MAIPVGRVTRGVILRQALQRAGNERLLTPVGTDPALARVKLNRILEDLYRDWDWPFLWKSATVQFGATFALPDDFDRSEDDLALTWLVNGYRRRAQEVDRYTFELKSGNVNVTASEPLLWSADRAAGIARVWPTPDSTVVATLRYKHQPADLDPTDVATYDADIPLFPWADYLMDAVFQWAQEYEQDPRAMQTLSLCEAKLARIRATAIPARSRQSVVPLDPDVFTPGPYRSYW